jgi:ER-bound oxygenase mpaB/B'/Rubber oxygenase, catalytic domain
LTEVSCAWTNQSSVQVATVGRLLQAPTTAPRFEREPNGRNLRRRSTVDMLVEGYFGEDAAIRRIARESVLMLGGPRALLMQAAHPFVAAGIVDHSRFRQDPWRRLARTMTALYTIVFSRRSASARSRAPPTFASAAGAAGAPTPPPIRG